MLSALHPQYYFFRPHSELSETLRAPTRHHKAILTFDLVTYFLFLVRGLGSDQDEGKCQDEAPPFAGHWVARLDTVCVDSSFAEISAPHLSCMNEGTN